jgi:hypothetical protein
VGDLYFDDITDEMAYPSPSILKDLRAIIAAGIREGQMIDYKSEISPKDNWPETVAAFANGLGGLIIFGIEGKGDQPRNLCGFDPKGVEVKTQLTSMVTSRIQPRPNFQIRVLTLDTDPSKEVAILRVSEGEHTPYMHSKEDQRRVYLRSGAQKVEADYLQLRSLFEKGQKKSVTPASISTLQTSLQVEDPTARAVSSDHFIKFIVAPFGKEAARRLTGEVENIFLSSFGRAFTDFSAIPRTERKQNLTIFKGASANGKLQNIAIDNHGVIGMVRMACIRTDKGLMFFPEEFTADLISFLVAASHYYDKINFYGDCQLTATILIPEAHDFRPGKFNGRLLTGSLFDPPIPVYRANFSAETRLSLHPQFIQRVPSYAEEIMTDFARVCGGMVSPSLAKFAEVCVADTLARFNY